MPFATTWMDLEISQTKTNIQYHLYVNLNSYTNEIICKAEIDSNTQKTSMVTKGDSRVRGKVEKDKLEVCIYTPAY